MNRKNTVIAVATTLVGVGIGAGTGVRYFKKDENKNKFLENQTVQKVRVSSSHFLEQVKNGNAKLQTFVKNYKNDLEAADADAEMQEKKFSPESKKSSVKNNTSVDSKNPESQPENIVETHDSVQKEA